jgi:hypothetical protein
MFSPGKKSVLYRSEFLAQNQIGPSIKKSQKIQGLKSIILKKE